MKATFRIWARFAAFVSAAGLFFGSTVILRAQTESAKAQSDSVVAVVADAEGLPLVPAEQVPFYGTFWIVRNSVPCVVAPLPCPPLDPNLPIYAISSRQFLVDETAGQLLISPRSALSTVDYGSIVQMQADELLGFVDWIQAVQLKTEMSTMDGEEGPPPPPGGGGGGGGGGDPQFDGPEYSTNDLWLEIISVTNGLANFTIHTPDTAAYDLFGTTNLSTDVPGLNGTNWVWLLRTDVGQTNIVLTNLWSDMGFFRLGTMQDSDNDGLTDAYENLVSHTNPQNPDTDGDGFTDGWEVANGLNPRLDDSAQPGSRLNYTYDGAGWLGTVSGAQNGSVTPDAEGNVLQVSQ